MIPKLGGAPDPEPGFSDQRDCSHSTEIFSAPAFSPASILSFLAPPTCEISPHYLLRNASGLSHRCIQANDRFNRSRAFSVLSLDMARSASHTPLQPLKFMAGNFLIPIMTHKITLRFPPVHLEGALQLSRPNRSETQILKPRRQPKIPNVGTRTHNSRSQLKSCFLTCNNLNNLAAKSNHLRPEAFGGGPV